MWVVIVVLVEGVVVEIFVVVLDYIVEVDGDVMIIFVDDFVVVFGYLVYVLVICYVFIG